MNPQAIPLEDDPCDVLAKAMRGRGISEQDLARLAGVAPASLRAVLDGDNIPEAIEKAAAVLELSATALLGLFSYHPDVPAPEGLDVFVSPFGHAGVNAFLIRHGQTATLVDAGTDAGPVAGFARNQGITITQILVTHRHADHVAGLKDLQGIPVAYPEDLGHGEELATAGGVITAVDASGHYTPARAYCFQGLGQPVCAVGDSVFAGSMGGAPGCESYRTALETARQNILSLPPETVICPGHGPLTTVGMEQTHNPFLNNGLKTSSHLS